MAYEQLLVVLVLASAVLFGYLAASLTYDERNIYRRYFRVIFIPLVLLAILFYFIKLIIAISLTFIVLLIFSWVLFSKASFNNHSKKKVSLKEENKPVYVSSFTKLTPIKDLKKSKKSKKVKNTKPKKTKKKGKRKK